MQQKSRDWVPKWMQNDQLSTCKKACLADLGGALDANSLVAYEILGANLTSRMSLSERLILTPLPACVGR